MSGRIHVSPKEARTFGGITFDSKAEMNRYAELLMLQRSRVICELELQPEFVLVEPFQHPILGKCRGMKYVADFRYRQHGGYVVEDVKGHVTEVYRIKRMLLLKKYPDLNFREITA
jgi:hypothetical protein